MSSKRDKSIDFSGYDWLGIGLCLSLMAIGWFMIFASEYNPDTYSGVFDLKRSYGKQLLWIISSLSIAIVAQFFNTKFYQTFAVVFWGISLFLLILVLFTNPVKGSTSWFDIGGFRLQPSEFAKTTTNMVLAALLAMPDLRMQSFMGRVQAFGVLAVPTLLVLLQGDAGSTLVYSSFLLVFFRAGLSPWLFIIGGTVVTITILSLSFDEVWPIALLLTWTGALLLLRNWNKELRWLLVFMGVSILIFFFRDKLQLPYIVIFYAIVLLLLSVVAIVKRQWQISTLVVGSITIALLFSSSVNFMVNKVLQPHQQERIWVWLRPEKCDPLGSLYNVEQSKYAIGSGGWSGKGFLEGERTKLDYVPEQSTDFIFCTVGEEWGFWGSSFVILLFVFLVLRILYLAERQRTDFSKYYMYGAASILLFHIFINVGMTMGLIPVIGIPLPFVSYGGSSMIAFSILISILFKLDADRIKVLR